MAQQNFRYFLFAINNSEMVDLILPTAEDFYDRLPMSRLSVEFLKPTAITDVPQEIMIKIFDITDQWIIDNPLFVGEAIEIFPFNGDGQKLGLNRIEYGENNIMPNSINAAGIPLWFAATASLYPYMIPYLPGVDLL